MSEEQAEGWDFETRAGLMLALFAAAMSISDLYAGKFGDDEIIGTNEKAAAFNWYQSKSTKETLLEAQRDLLLALEEVGAITAETRPALDKQVQTLEGEIKRYGMEKKEILLGSAAVGPEGQVQEVDGEKGKVVGAKEWEGTLEKLGAMGDAFDLGGLFYQLCMVMGAVSITLKSPGIRNFFFWSMVVLGISGTAVSVYAMTLAP